MVQELASSPKFTCRVAIGAVLLRKVLTKAAGAHLPGTRITKTIAKDIEKEGIREVKAVDSKIKITTIMAAATRTPLLNPNWMQRLGFRYQKQTLINAATFGETADLHSHNPIPGLAFGKEFRRDSKGRY